MKKMISAIFIIFILPVSSCLAVENRTLHFMFGISDLYSPVLSDKENKAVLESLRKGAIVSATYRHTTREFHWFSTMSGVATIPDPGYKYTSTDDHRSYTLIPEPGNSSIMGVDIPILLEGDYVLAELYVQLSPSIYQQPGYLAAVKDLPQKDQKFAMELRSSSSFRYLVSLDNTKKENPIRERQGCLFVTTPYGYPDTSIPVVTLVGTKLISANLAYIINEPCPLVDVKKSEQSTIPGHLPPARVAAAKSSLDYSTTKGITKKWGEVPVTKEMARWYQRNNEGVYAALKRFGPFELFSMRVRWDSLYPDAKRLPIRTETWYFHNKELVKYSSSIYYESTDSEKDMSADEVVYFNEKNKVFTESTQDNCNSKGCMNAQVDIKQHSNDSWYNLQQEALHYMQLPLIPATDE